MSIVIHTLPSTSNEASGPSYSVSNLCKSLNRLGEKTRLITIGTDANKIEDHEFIKTFPYGFGPKKLGNSPQMQYWLEQQAKAGNVKLFHNHSLWMMPNVYPGQIAAKYKIPYVVSPRGCFTEYAMQIGSKVKKLFWPLIQKPALNSVSMFHATAESEYEDIRRMGYRQPVTIIPNGIDLPSVKKENNSSGYRTLLFLGRIHPNKGLDLLLPAWKNVQDIFPNWSLSIVGPDEDGYLNQVKKLANTLALQRIEFTGPLYGEEKWKKYASSDLFILPSYSENFGMSIAESLAAGTPAIVTKGAPWSGLVSHNAGWWIDLSVESLTICLKDALDQTRNQLSEMGNCGKDWMRNEYSWKVIGSKMVESYNWLLNGKEKPNYIINGK